VRDLPPHRKLRILVEAFKLNAIFMYFFGEIAKHYSTDQETIMSRYEELRDGWAEKAARDGKGTKAEMLDFVSKHLSVADKRDVDGAIKVVFTTMNGKEGSREYAAGKKDKN